MHLDDGEAEGLVRKIRPRREGGEDGVCPALCRNNARLLGYCQGFGGEAKYGRWADPLEEPNELDEGLPLEWLKANVHIGAMRSDRLRIRTNHVGNVPLRSALAL